jgi:hypothetical protein
VNSTRFLPILKCQISKKRKLFVDVGRYVILYDKKAREILKQYLLKGSRTMEKKIALFAATLTIVIVTNSVVFALSPMGPPKAMPGQDQWDIGVEYGNLTMDLKASGTDTNIEHIPSLYITTGKGKYEIKDLQSNIILGRLSYGISNNWEAFVRLGVVDAECDLEQTFPDSAQHKYRGFDGSFGLAWGFGTRATFWQDEDISWGGLFQMTWMEPDKSDISSIISPGNLNYSGTADIDIREVQIAVGPTWRVEDNIRIYGGPFLHFVDGDLDLSGTIVDPGVGIDMESSGDIEEESQFGGYVGADLDVDKNTSCFIECQLTNDAWGIGIGASRRF